MGEIPDGVYDVVGETIRVMAVSDRSRAQMQRLARILQEARAANTPAADVAQRIEAEAPEFADVAKRLLIPKDAAAFYALLAILVAVLLTVLSKPDTVSEQELQHVLDRGQLQAPPVTLVLPAPLSTQPPVALPTAIALPQQSPSKPTRKTRAHKRRAPKTYGQQKHKRR